MLNDDERFLHIPIITPVLCVGMCSGCSWHWRCTEVTQRSHRRHIRILMGRRDFEYAERLTIMLFVRHIHLGTSSGGTNRGHSPEALAYWGRHSTVMPKILGIGVSPGGLLLRRHASRVTYDVLKLGNVVERDSCTACSMCANEEFWT